MSIFSLFKKTKTAGKDSTINSEELLDIEVSESNSIKTELSYHPSWNVPKEQQYVFQFLLNELEPLKPNQLSLSGLEIDEEDDSWLVKAFFRSSLAKPMELGSIELLLLDASNDVIASQQFDFSELGEIPGNSARPWVFKFDKPTIDSEELPAEGWQLAFNLKSFEPHKLELHESWEKSLPKEQKEALEQLVKSLPSLNEDEVNITGVQLKEQPDDGLAVTVFVRNGSNKSLSFQQLPLVLSDANNEIVAQGSFKLDNFEVQSNTTKPWTFIFPKELVNKEAKDLSKWTVKINQ
ncbi:accessory Sec system S-layer assembly protein [Psychrobacillus sp. OK028]|uniref:accessory Sec system S-layer assembly protein n=1 Tax=Psychrobacillus sp. OK028 TaxID=1884359 RepID=UPI00087F01DC|nr:accessory Sec system S-layer assembly protein [Psychrobacillus sp. OK028]SDM42483.1 accessory Sec system S-layer assembly protein [Psychrobacillus sp. OK028]